MLLEIILTATLNAAPSPDLSPQTAASLIGTALTDGQAYAHLAELTDTVGQRISGSPGDAAAVRWALAKFKADGVKAHLEPVKVPHWVRGAEAAELVLPGELPHPLAVTALGGSGATPAEGITAPVVEVWSVDQLKALGPDAKGKIIFLNHAMKVADDYGKMYAVRTGAPAEALKLGALATVVRSLASGPPSRAPHTGNFHLTPGATELPAAAISTDDAEMVHRALSRSSGVKLHLTLRCQTLPDADSFNVVGEVRGREHPEEIVVAGAHLDSWDLATGAQDDGAGVVFVMEAARLIAAQKTPPRRTVRFVLFANEESGLAGGKAYAAAHAAELPKTVFAIEADSGAGAPQGAVVMAGAGAENVFKAWGAPLAVLGATDFHAGDAEGADLSPMKGAGVPFSYVKQEREQYFEMHHSALDTIDLVNPQALAQTSAAFTWIVFAAAESKEKLPRK